MSLFNLLYIGIYLPHSACTDDSVWDEHGIVGDVPASQVEHPCDVEANKIKQTI